MKQAMVGCFICMLLLCGGVYSQIQINTLDTTINNLIHARGYKTCEYGSIPHFVKEGQGKRTLILIPGLGFDASVFSDFMEANIKNYTMYAITIPGYGHTSAPPMPPAGTSYGEQSWNSSAIHGLIRLIKEERLQKPIIVGHFVQGTQLALRMAIEHPEYVGGVIILGGPAKFISTTKGKPRSFPLDTMVLFTDKYTAPKWFKHMKKDFFDDNNFMPEIYSLDSAKGTELWNQSAKVSLPVMVRYSCEYFACDVKAEIDNIQCPVLVLRSVFNKKVLDNPVNNYLQPQFIDSWDDVTQKNPSIQIKDINNAGSFIWKDRPDDVYAEIDKFLNNIKKK